MWWLTGCVGGWTLHLVPRTLDSQAPFDGGPGLTLVLPGEGGTPEEIDLGFASGELTAPDLGPLALDGTIGLRVAEPEGGAAYQDGLRAWGQTQVPDGVQGGRGEVTLEVLVPESHKVGLLGQFEPKDVRHFSAAAMIPGGDIFVFGGVLNPTSDDSLSTILALRGTDFGSVTPELLDAGLPGVGGGGGPGRVGAVAVVVLENDKPLILVTGGRPTYLDTSGNMAQAFLFDPESEAVIWEGEMAVGRSQHVAVSLANGEVLLVGGYQGDDGLGAGSFEYFEVENRRFVEGDGELAFGSKGIGVADLGAEGVLVCGGASSCAQTDVDAGACEVADLGAMVPSAGCSVITPNRTVVDTEPMPVATQVLSLAPVGDGRVLAVGGVSTAAAEGTAVEASARAWVRNENGEWRGIGEALHARAHHALLPIGNGNVLVVGGATEGGSVLPDPRDAVTCVEVFQGNGEAFFEPVNGCSPVGAGADPVIASWPGDGAFVLTGYRVIDGEYRGADAYGLVGLGP